MRELLVTLILLGAFGAKARENGDPDALGTWRYRDATRKVKVVIIGGSITAWPSGNFGDFLVGACKNIELVNRGQVGDGALALKQRFRRQLLQNPNVKLKDKAFEYWLLFNGGLNSIFSADSTIKFTSEMFQMAHDSGVHVAALSLTPWGADQDSRWRGLSGLTYFDRTKKVVDFTLGRLKRYEALGGTEAEWHKGELPDVAVDLYDSALRNAEAPLRDAVRLGKSFAANKALQREYPDAQAAIARAAAVPRWYMKPLYKAFDHIHPNTEGHRLIAELSCPKMPASWGCDCPAIKTLVWKGRIVRP